jgi:hypothetical protein
MGGHNAVTFDKLGKLLRCALERDAVSLTLDACDGEHLFAHRKAKVIAPFHVLSDAWERQAEFTELFDVHKRSWGGNLAGKY